MNAIKLMILLGTFCLTQAHAENIQRFLLLTSSNEGGSGRPTLRYAASDAKSMMRVFEDMGGVAKENQVLVEDPSPNSLRKGLDQITVLLQRAPKADRKEVMVYYSGHADEQGLLLGNNTVTWKELRTRIEALPADVRITILDACGSGAIVRAKGGQRRPAFLVDESSNMKGTAFLTSSTEDEVSQESDALRASFFTHAFVTGLRGAADLNGDKKVTLGEAYQFAFQETTNSTEATIGGMQHPSRDLNLSGSGDVVMTDLRGIGSAILLNKDLQGRFYIRDQQGQLVAELHKPLGRDIELGLSPGTYLVRVEIQTLSEAKVTLPTGGRVSLTTKNFSTVSMQQTRSRGTCGECSEKKDWRADIAKKPTIFQWDILRAKADTSIHGTQMSMLLNEADQGIQGYQFSFLGLNYANRGFDGLQLALLGTIAGDSSNGVQVSATVNYAHNINGVQAGYVNISKNLHGVQAGMVNVAKDLHGLQAGLVNVSGSNKNGVQVGFVNTSKASHTQVGFINVSGDAKAPIGFFSYSAKGIYGFKVSVDEMRWRRLSIFSGSPVFYNVFEWSQDNWNPETIGTGYGIGTRFGMQGPLWVSLDASSHFIQKWDSIPIQWDKEARPHNPDSLVRNMDFNSLHRVKLEVGYNITRHIGFSAGMSANMLQRDSKQAIMAKPIGDWQSQEIIQGSQRMIFWTGFQANIIVGRLGN
jgi:hypothetical protein